VGRADPPPPRVRHHRAPRPQPPCQGSRLVRWAAVEAVQRLPVDFKLRVDRDRIADRRGRNIGKVAAARRLLTLLFYGLRDGRIRCLEQAAA